MSMESPHKTHTCVREDETVQRNPLEGAIDREITGQIFCSLSQTLSRPVI